MSQSRSPQLDHSEQGSSSARSRGSEILERLLRVTPDVGMVALDPHGRILEWNAGAANLYGYTLEEVHLEPLARLYPGDRHGSAAAEGLLEDAIRSGRGEAEGWRLRGDGARFWGQEVLTRLHGANGDCIGFGLVVRDDTGRRQIQEVLRKSERRFRAAQERSRDAHAMLGSVRNDADEIVDFEFLYANPAAMRVYGGKRLDVSGARLREQEPRVLAEDLFHRCVQVLEAGEPIEEEVHHEHADGIESYRVTAVEVGDGVALSISDLTRVRRAERALDASEDRYLQAQKMESLGRLASGVAHDFNNMLTAIMINAHLLLQNLPEGDPRRLYSQEIDAIAGHAANLTHQILAYAGREASEQRILDLNGVISVVAMMLRRLIGEDVKLHIALDPALPPVKADPVHVQQVLLNLVINARDAMPGGGRITIETRRLVKPERRAAEEGEAPEVMLSVSDTGTGIDPAARAHIFEPFFTTKEAGRGTGLGLATVDAIVKRSGGVVRVESEGGKGTTFHVLLPAAPGAEVEPVRGGEAPEHFHGSETVLLVEDDGAVRDAARTVLRNGGYRVLEADCGRSACRVSEEHEGSIDLLVADVRMPGMSGPRLADRLQVHRPRLRALFMTGYGRGGVGTEDGESGAAVLAKPFSPAALLRAVRATLDDARPTERVHDGMGDGTE